ncbi:MAG: hypothetical protein ACOCRX_01500 [Candidatus Woesearchaeota archaeon]
MEKINNENLMHTKTLNDITNKLKYCFTDFSELHNVTPYLKIYKHGEVNNHIFININNKYIVKCFLHDIKNMLLFYTVVELKTNRIVDKDIICKKNQDKTINFIIEKCFEILENDIIK